jgi:asparagine synthase (glutamine-hydrolysing)
VLPHLYEEYGDELVHALEGMFALAIWDSRRLRLLLARDRFGEKPLFLSESGGRLSFASELRALTRGLPGKPDLDPRALDAFFVFGYIPGPGSALEGIHQLPPGHLLSWDHERRRSEQRRYWHPPAHGAATSEGVGELAAEAGRLLAESVRSRLLADVPLGIFLSGGVDSSLIAALAARQTGTRIKTFTVGYDDGERDERAAARSVASLLGSDHHELTLTSAEAATRVPSLLGDLDQPLADQAIVPLHAVAEFAVREVTVAVGGEGADELFGGYPRYRWLRRAPETVPGWLQGRLGLPQIPVAPPTSGRTRRALDLATPRPALERHLDWVSAGRRNVRESIYGPAMGAGAANRDLQLGLVAAINGSANGSVTGALMQLDQRHWLPDDVLFKADRAGMLVSLEVRTPYLQRDLAEFAASVPPELHVSGGGKRLLRHLLGRLEPGAPQRRKKAFLPPAAEWLRGPLSPILEDQIRHGSLFREGWFQPDAVARLARQHIEGRTDWTHVLWPLLAAGLWLDRHRGRAPD